MYAATLCDEAVRRRPALIRPFSSAPLGFSAGASFAQSITANSFERIDILYAWSLHMRRKTKMQKEMLKGRSCHWLQVLRSRVDARRLIDRYIHAVYEDRGTQEVSSKSSNNKKINNQPGHVETKNLCSTQLLQQSPSLSSPPTS